MKKVRLFIIFALSIMSCQDDDVNVFEKTADERVAEAISNLKAKLVDPENGWLVRYTPAGADAGSFYVIMKFNEDNTVNIKSDLAADDGTYFDQTITYRIDNSLGIELVLESYSFFAYLYELDLASFPAEYEFMYEEETDEGNLIFRSKSDLGADKTNLTLIPATATSTNLLGIELASNLSNMSEEIDKFTSSLAMNYDDKDLALYLSLDEAHRTITITSASKISNTNTIATIDHTTPYIISGDSIVFDIPLTGNILGNSISISSIRFTSTFAGSINTCDAPINTTGLIGVTSQGHDIELQTSLFDAGGSSFTSTDFYVSPNYYIFNNGESAEAQILEDLEGALAMQLYYDYDLGSESFNGIGFVLSNADGTTTFALKEFTPVLNGNNLIFQFADEISVFGSPNPDADIDNVNYYLDQLTSGDDTYVFKISDGLYEFYNPCTQWSFVFVDPNN